MDKDGDELKFTDLSVLDESTLAIPVVGDGNINITLPDPSPGSLVFDNDAGQVLVATDMGGSIEWQSVSSVQQAVWEVGYFVLKDTEGGNVGVLRMPIDSTVEYQFTLMDGDDFYPLTAKRIDKGEKQFVIEPCSEQCEYYQFALAKNQQQGNRLEYRRGHLGPARDL